MEGRSQRRVAREFGISRVTVRKYVEGAQPVRREAAPQARPIWEKVGPPDRGAARSVNGVDGRQAAVDGDARVLRHRPGAATI